MQRIPSSEMGMCKGHSNKVFLKNLVEIFGILLSSFKQLFKKPSLTNGNLTKSHCTSTQRHTIGMWSLPLLNDESVYDPESRFVCPSVEINKKTKLGKEWDMKTYSIDFTQKFEESRNVLANSEEEAEQKIRDEWENSVGAEVEIHQIIELDKKGGNND